MNTVMKSIIKIWNKIRFWAVGPHNVVILSLQRAVCILFYNLFCLHNWLALPKAMRLGYARGTFTMEDLQRDSNRFLPSSKYGFRWSIMYPYCYFHVNSLVLKWINYFLQKTKRSTTWPTSRGERLYPREAWKGLSEEGTPDEHHNDENEAAAPTYGGRTFQNCRCKGPQMEKCLNSMEPSRPEESSSRRGQGGRARGGLGFILRPLRSHHRIWDREL